MNQDTEYTRMLNRMSELITESSKHYGPLGNAEAKKAKEIIANCANDKIEINDRPICQPITKELFFKDGTEPDWIKDTFQKGNSFYFIRFPIDIKSHYKFEDLSFRMDFTKINKDYERPTFYNFFPNDSFIRYLQLEFKGNATAQAGLDLSKIPIGLAFGLPIPINASINTNASLTLGFNFTKNFEKQTIKTSSKGQHFVSWQFNERIDSDKLESFGAIIEAPENLTEMKIEYTLTAKRNVGLLDKYSEIFERIYTKGDEKDKKDIDEGLPYKIPDPLVNKPNNIWKYKEKDLKKNIS